MRSRRGGGAYGDESQDGVEDVEHSERSGLVRYRGIALQLALEADG